MSEATAIPDPKDFSVDERPREYHACFRVTGEITVTIMADSEADARAKAETMLVDDEFGTELDEVDDIDISYISKSRPMYRVIRDGQSMQVSRLKTGDVPRAPDARGF